MHRVSPTSPPWGFGCAAQFSKPCPYFRPKYQMIGYPFSKLSSKTHIHFQTWFLGSIPVFRLTLSDQIGYTMYHQTGSKIIPIGAAHTYVIVYSLCRGRTLQSDTYLLCNAFEWYFLKYSTSDLIFLSIHTSLSHATHWINAKRHSLML